MMRWELIDNEVWPQAGVMVALRLYGEHHIGEVQPHQVRVTGIPVRLDTGQTRMFLLEELHPVVKGVTLTPR